MGTITKAWRCEICHFKIYTTDNRKPLQVIWENDWGQDISKFSIHACMFKEVNTADSLKSDEIAIEKASNMLAALDEMLSQIERLVGVLGMNPRFTDLLKHDPAARELVESLSMLKTEFKQN